MHKPAVAAVAALSLFVSDAHAQDAAIDEIVVTADLRGRTLVEIPASIAVIDRSTVEDAAVQHFEELSFLVPNLNFAGGSNRARYFQLRGIGERSQYEGAPNPSVGFILDDIDFSGIGGIATTWDIERVEVLRGPQATRYGANALAGLVFVQSVAPTPEFDARAQVTSGDDGLASAALAFGGPVNDTLGYRVALQQFQSNGFRDNPFLGRDDTNERDELTLRTRLRWDPSNETRVDTTLLFVDQDNGYDAFTLENDFTTFSDDPGRDAQRSVGLGIRADHAPSAAWSFTSITGIAQSDVEFSFDADWGNPDYWIPFFAPPGSTPFTPEYDFFSRRDRERDTINQEFRLQSGPDGRLFDDTTDWLAGVYALRLTEDLTVFDSGVFSDGTFPGDPFAASSDSSYESLKLAVFGQLDIATGERTDLSLGLRVERRTADYEDDFGLSLDPSETAVGGHISLTHAINDAATGYVSLARGYKMGGFNLGTVPDGRREFDAEYLWNLETGL
ncbi:MAG: TonB-dependent receptor, partial [Pseudomonadota bacterium]